MSDNQQSVATSSTQSTPKIKVPQKVKSQLFLPLPIDFEQSQNRLISKYLIFLPYHNKIEEIIIDLDNQATVSQAISQALRHFYNQKLTIDINPDHYELFVAKKNGLPKQDYPSFETHQLISKTQNKQFTLAHSVFTEKIIMEQEKNLLLKNFSFQEGNNKQISKRKNTDSPMRQEKQVYVNSLASQDEFKMKRKSLSKEIQLQVGTKKSNWFLQILGCGCNQNKTEF